MATSRTVKRYRDDSRSTEWLSTRSNSIKTPLTSCGVYDALDQRWEQARAVADPPSASVPPTRSRVSQERFAFHILLTFGRFACPHDGTVHCRRRCLFYSTNNFFWAGRPKASGHALEPQEQDASADMRGFSGGTFFTRPYPQPRGDSTLAAATRSRDPLAAATRHARRRDATHSPHDAARSPRDATRSPRDDDGERARRAAGAVAAAAAAAPM
jgi:hypothetical protein